MTEAEWLQCVDPTPMIEFLGSNPGSLKSGCRKYRLFATACCRRYYDSIVDHQSRDAIEAAEQFADGKQSQQFLVEYRKKVDKHRRKMNAEGGIRRDIAAAAWWASHDYQAEKHVGFKVTQAKAWMQNVGGDGEAQRQGRLLKDIFGNPFRPIAINPAWLTPQVISLATVAYEERSLPSGELDTARLAVLADALEDAGCSNADILGHLRNSGVHVRGCWALDLLLGKE